MVFSNIKNGFTQVWKNKRLIIVFYLANLLFGLVLMLPFRAVLDNFSGKTLMGAKLAGRLDMDFLFDLLTHNQNMVSIFTGMVLVVPAVYWLFSLFLSGGAFSVLVKGEKYSAAMFWNGAATYFGRFFRIFLWSLPVLGILFCVQFIETGLERLIFGKVPYQNISYWGGWVKFSLRTLSILLFGLVLDYARIHAVLTDEKRMRVSVWQGIKFAFGNIGRTFGLTFILFLAGAVVLVIYNPISNALAAPNVLVVIALFLLQQTYMMFRMTLRLTLFASQLNLYNKLSTESEEVTVPAAAEPGLAGTV
ncbi:hypothetical protein IH970_08420 [candidate division KSB1 bacterium]|nr:hypothetical protein [candidate division KSB1 bacterium]